MAYAYEGIAQTQKGKVIYRRKKHFFKPKDLHRLIKKLDFPADLRERYDWYLAVLDLLDLVRRTQNGDVQTAAGELNNILTTFIASSPEFKGFSGGQFGGAGAGGTFWKPFPT